PVTGGPLSMEPNAATGSENSPAPNSQAAQLKPSPTPAAVAGAPIFDPNRTAEATGGLLAQEEYPYPVPETSAVATATATVLVTTANTGAAATRTPALFP